ncbi:MAG: 30S ribosomal protein S8 [Deltaproteobacteria bacterium]|nr:30S ribosomal protein S8 [Deltaproteobacteria bacterium]
MTDPIADLLTRIRNALSARHATVTIPSSKIKEAIVKILRERGFISNYIMEEKKPQNEIKVFLKYDGRRKTNVKRLARVSRPGGRVYRGYREMKPLLRGMGVTIFSTPKGILTEKEAREAKVGGEVLCEIY